MKLTHSQKQAVVYNDGPLLIIAGAGTGKTTVLVEKIKYLIAHKLARPDEILALTFTEKAVNEIEERVDKILPYGYFQTHIATFHSFCDGVLKEDGMHMGLSPEYKLYTQAQSIIYLQKKLFLFNLDYFRPLGNPYKFIEGLIQHFSRLRDEDIAPENYMKWARAQEKVHKVESPDVKKNTELAHAYTVFQDIKLKDTIMDFADLIFYTVKLFRARQNIKEKYKARFKYILVDEFQDTNIAQYELIKLLAPPQEQPKLSVIGDDNQSIYKFRGASVSNILQFMKDYGQAKQMVLLENYRSNQHILDIAYRVITHNNPDTLESRLNISKNLKSMTGKGNGESVSLFVAPHITKECEYVAEKIQELITKGYKYRDIALLMRANSHADPFAHTFERHGIPFQFLGQGMLFKQPEIKDLIAYLTFLTDVSDSASFYRVISMDIFHLDEKDVARFISFSKRTNLSLFEAMHVYLSFFYTEYARSEFEIYRRELFITRQETKETIKKIYGIVERALSLFSKETVGQILYFFLEESGYLSYLASAKTAKDERKVVNISRFFEFLKTREVRQEDASVEAAVDFIHMCMEFKESPLVPELDISERDAVNILTVHSAKGMEFKVVFLVNLTLDRFPTRERREPIPIPDELIKEILPEGDYHLEEERRLFYVGVTRARDKVYFTSSLNYGEGRRMRKVSPFVVEAMGEDFVQRLTHRQKEEKSQLSIFDPDLIGADPDSIGVDFKKHEEKKDKEPVFSRPVPSRLSYSQIESYKTCPLRYKYQYVLKIPTLPSAAASFGDSIHRALQKFYLFLKKVGRVTLDDLFTFYEMCWLPLGYVSRTHEEKMKKEGKKMLQSFFMRYHTDNLSILDLEKRFTVKIDETTFISGKIDRVDARKDGGLEIIDYKTGKKPTLPALKKNLQMSLYALAVSDKSFYAKPVDDITLTFHFLQDADVFSTKKKPEDIEEAKAVVKNTISQIQKGLFAANVGPWCDFCPFRINCEAWQ